MAETTVVQAEDVVPVRTRVSWGAIFAGAALAFTVYFVLSLLGTAVGLSVRDQMTNDSLGVGALVWAVASLIVALFAGGYVTSHCTVGETHWEAAVHGIIMWGVLFVAIVWIAAGTARTGFSALSAFANVTTTARTTWPAKAGRKRRGAPACRRRSSTVGTSASPTAAATPPTRRHASGWRRTRPWRRGGACSA